MNKLLLMLALAGCGHTTLSTFPAKSEIARVDDAVFKIEETLTLIGGEINGSGTAFVITSHSGHSILGTAGHVCNRVGDVVIDHEVIATKFWIDYNGGKLPAKVIFVDHDVDTCLVQVDVNLPSALHLAKFAPGLYDQVWYLGYPTGAISIEDGIVTKLDESGQYLMNIPAAGGASGSPILDDNGDVVGVLVATRRGFDGTSYSVGFVDVKTLWLKALISSL